jgi:transcriptional regulator with XRE-family HTH domain
LLPSRKDTAIVATLATEGYGPLVGQIGRNLRQLRDERGVKLAELSDRMGQLGQPLGITGLSKVENGKRGVDLDELAALARALNVPPLLLIFPLGKQPTIEVLPGVEQPTWPAARWFTGEEPFRSSALTRAEFEAWEEAATAYFRRQDRIFEQWDETRERIDTIRKMLAAGDPAKVEPFRSELEGRDQARVALEDQLKLHRRVMRDHGLDPGNLPEELAHLDGANHGER